MFCWILNSDGIVEFLINVCLIKWFGFLGVIKNILILVGGWIILKWMLKLWVNVSILCFFKFGLILFLYILFWILLGNSIIIILVCLIVFVIGNILNLFFLVLLKEWFGWILMIILYLLFFKFCVCVWFCDL